MSERAIRRICIVFAVLGVGLLAASTRSFYTTHAFIESSTTTVGTVVALIERRTADGSSYAPVVRFKTDGGDLRTFMSATSEPRDDFVEGQSVEVLYNPKNAAQACISTFAQLWFVTLVLAGLGVACLSAAAGVFGTVWQPNNEKLRRSGRPLTTRVHQVVINKSFDFNGRNPFRIIAEWQDPSTKQVHLFKSKNIWFDPQKYLKGRKITVYVSPNSLRKYYVDVSFLPEQG